MNKVDQKRIDELFARGTVTDIFPSKEALTKKLLAGEKIKIYLGLDPTHTAIHLGHAKNIMFMEELRQLGNEVIILFGDFTARIGDPDKASTRKALSEEDVTRNMADWVRQISPLIDFNDKTNPATIRHNSEWLAKLSFADVLSLSSNFTVQQMIERDMFQKRLKEGSPIHLHEFMYPLMQGYDSVAMDVDAELCGTDQIFNALSGRTLMKKLKDKEKFVIALNLIANPATGQLMSKSNGTGVFIDQSANDLFGALMSLPDPMIEPLFLNCTRIPMGEKDMIMAQGPRMAKALIAKDIVKRIHGEAASVTAEEAFIATFAKGGVPDDILEIKLDGATLAEVLIKAGVIESKTEWRRLVTDTAVRTDRDEKITDPTYVPASGTILKIGKRRFVKII
ncbi:MAG: tyrosine--tRNA ligase [Candidatus Pacebacteria bacterium]|nr:tyrosine--tRNA ligase [Candidatus Paceibacterota bacterium]